MKFLSTFLVFILVLTSNIQAQEYISKGHSVLSGSFGGSSREFDSGDGYLSDNNSLTISTQYGKFVKDNLALGVGTSLFTSKSTTTNADSERLSKSNGFSFSIFARKYYPINEKFGAYWNSNLGYSYDKNTSEFISSTGTNNTFEEQKNDRINLTANLGLYYFIWKRLSLEANLGHVSIGKTISNTGSAKSEFFGVNFVNTLSFEQFFTINYYF